MARAVVKWLQNKTFVGTDSSKHSVVLSTQDADNAVGMRPSELLLVALAACSAVDVVEILAKKRTPVESLEIEVTGEQDENPPWPFRKIHLDYRLQGRGLTAQSVDQCIRLSEGKYCSVAATLRGVAEITYEYHIEPEAGDGREELSAGLPKLSVPSGIMAGVRQPEEKLAQ